MVTQVGAIGRNRAVDISGAPNRRWVAEITFVRTWQGFCYTAFITDACTKKGVGWAVSATMRTGDLPLQAFNCAVWQANSTLRLTACAWRDRSGIGRRRMRRTPRAHRRRQS